MSDEPIEIAYRTTIDEPRTGRIGSGLRWLGRHPLLGGLICGLAVVAIAVAVQPGGFATAPTIAAAISATVVLVWMVLFFLMRSFFEAQSYARFSVVRRLNIDDDRAVWTQQNEPLRSLENPRIQLYATAVPEGIGDDAKGRSGPTAWPVWIVIDGDGDDPIVFETRDPASRARNYTEISDDLIEATDERLPRAIAAPLLRQAEG